MENTVIKIHTTTYLTYQQLMTFISSLSKGLCAIFMPINIGIYYPAAQVIIAVYSRCRD